MTTKTFRIENSSSGHIFGTYSGETAEDAIASMMRDAGSDEEPSEEIVAIEIAYTLTSTKGSKTITGTETEAIAAAVEMERDLRPAYGVTVELDGATVAEVRDGEVEREDDEQPEISCLIYAAHCAEDAESIPAAEWKRLASETEQALSAAYPTAKVSVEIRHGVRGVGSGTTYSVDGEKDDAESADATAIAERAWERWCATMPAESADAS